MAHIWFHCVTISICIVIREHHHQPFRHLGGQHHHRPHRLAPHPIPLHHPRHSCLRLSPRQQADNFPFKHHLNHCIVVVRRRYRGGSVREPLITFERDMDCRFLFTILPGYFLSIILYCVTIALLRKEWILLLITCPWYLPLCYVATASEKINTQFGLSLGKSTSAHPIYNIYGCIMCVLQIWKKRVTVYFRNHYGIKSSTGVL